MLDFTTLFEVDDNDVKAELEPIRVSVAIRENFMFDIIGLCNQPISY